MTAVVISDSVDSISRRYADLLPALEWGFTLLFSLEYLARLWCVRQPFRYARSFFGIVDLLSFLPSYLLLLFPEAVAFQAIRALRLLRIFRILKLGAYVAEYRALGAALRGSARKILIFLSVVVVAVLLLGTAMYVVEGPDNGYTSIPTAVY